MKTPFKTFYQVIAPLIMGKGVGDGKTTACVMAQAAIIDALRKGLTLEKPTDEMNCACPVLRRLAIRLNDMDCWKDDNERTEVLRPLIPMLLDSNGGIELTNRRKFFCCDNVVRVLTPARLRWISKFTKNKGVKDSVLAGAKELESLNEIKKHDDAAMASSIARRLRASSAAAYDYASDYAYAYADAYAAADAYDYASDYTAYDYASAAADAAADADADADAEEKKKQKILYRSMLLQLFKDCSALK